MIAFTSDLHLGITTENALAELADEMRAARPDALILGGDIGEGSAAFARALELMADVAPKRGYVPGNHDVWSREGWSTSELYTQRLPEIAREHGYDGLKDVSWRFGTLAVVTSMAWYDYSAIDKAFAAEDSETIARRKHEFNNDARFVTWPWDDVAMAKKLRAGVEQRLVDLERDPRIRRIVVATHVPILEEQMLRKPGDSEWGFSNAYFGHLRLGAVVARFRKVTDVVSGHTHAEQDAVIERAGMPAIRVRVNGGSYGNPQWIRVD